LLEVRHWPVLSQQPFGQEVASQTQAPEPLQRWPVAQAAQVPPPTPQADRLSVVTQPPLLQQPFRQEVASQTQVPLPLHSCPPGQALQAAPPTPQVELLEVWH
jgi:hypothetical protein